MGDASQESFNLDFTGRKLVSVRVHGRLSQMEKGIKEIKARGGFQDGPEQAERKGGLMLQA